MATTTATITLSSADLTSQALSITSTATLYKAGTTVGLDQTTGLTRSKFAAAQSNATLISAGSYDDNTAGKVYVKNVGSSSYEGEQDIDISSTGTNMELEYMVIYQAA